MLKQTIVYKDFDDQLQSEDFYFNLTKAELLDMAVLSGYDDYGAYLQALVKTDNKPEIYRIFKSIILKSYGIRVDGKRFRKSPEIAEDFITTAAYDALMTKIFTDEEDFAIKFLMGLLPQEIQEEANAGKELVKPETKARIAETTAESSTRALGVPADLDILKMGDAEFKRLVERRRLLQETSTVPAAFAAKANRSS